MSNYEKSRVGAKTDQGPIRPVNEDHFWVTDAEQPNHLGALYIVADGVGGQEHGAAASQIATKVISKLFYEAREDGASIVNSLADAILAANDAIFAESQKRGGGKMGSTLVTAVEHEGKLTIAHIGDARAYLVQGKKLRRLTKDDTWVQKQVDAGIISKEDAARHELRNVVTQVLGNKPDLNVHISPPLGFEEGDIFMLCSDGVYDVIEKKHLYRTLKDMAPQQAAESLVEQAIGNGTTDNVTAIVVHSRLTTTDPDATFKEKALQVPAADSPDATYHDPGATISIPAPGAAVTAPQPAADDIPQRRFPRWGIYLIVAAVIIALLVVIGGLLLRNDNIGITFSSSESSGESDEIEGSDSEDESGTEAGDSEEGGDMGAPKGEDSVQQIIVTPTPLPPTATAEPKLTTEADMTSTPEADSAVEPTASAAADAPLPSPTAQTFACVLNLSFVWTEEQVNSDSCGQNSEISLPTNSKVIVLSGAPRLVRGPDTECANNNMLRVQSLDNPEIIGWVLDYTLETATPEEDCSPSP